jgi:hypothetical protein
MERTLKKPLRPSRIEKLTLAVVTMTFKSVTQYSIAQLRQVFGLFQPETDDHARVMSHESLILRMVYDNPDWGYDRLEGELRKVGHIISDQTIGNILT